ncbi:hypothetical protein QBC40DRAFT_289377 [Triangularia verruculosa]|uniref:Early meiotic induction protein 1 n=1 Tax=Triangularia verruculosa TaxID=2587418 RepID=A0AAN7ANF5_9PEZI|nr:hypothetical protein QBC40DRAFT_289377 [Triangularia verruculosa]
MGWFWNSPSPSPKAPEAIPGTSPSSIAQPSPSSLGEKKPSTDDEVSKFLREIQAAANPSSQPAPPQAPEPEPDAAKASWLPSWLSAPAPETPPPPPKDKRSEASIAMSEALLPTTMSCQDAFDYAWHCHTPGSQVNSVYRYGGVRQCTELWDDFWFCMRTKSWEPQLRAEAIKDHFRKKEAAKYGHGQPSSEDIWESRDGKVEPGTTFNKSFDPPIKDDAAFEREDQENRRSIREFYEKKT